MKIIVAIVVGWIGGFFAGIVLSEVIGIVGVLVFDQIVGIKFLSLYTAVAGAIVAPIIVARRQQRTR